MLTELMIENENEKKANQMIGRAVIVLIIAIVASVIFDILFDFTDYNKTSAISFIASSLVGIVGIILSRLIGNKYFYSIKYILIATFLMQILLLGVCYPTMITVLFLLPMLLAARYYDKHFNIRVQIISVVFLILAWIGSTYFQIYPDMNLVTFTEPATIHVPGNNYGFVTFLSEIPYNRDSLMNDYLHYGLLPTLPTYAMFIILFNGLMDSGLFLVRSKVVAAEEKTALEKTLSIAEKIQNDMLPDQDELLSDTWKEYIDVAAVMKAARVVGGDLYDCFATDSDHVCFLVGDVCGKGVPASLFMARAITCLKDLALMGLPAKEILEQGNNILTSRNKEQYFVTTFIGILDLRTGVMEYCVGGHNPPLIYSEGAAYKYLTTQKNIALGMIDGMNFIGETLKLEPGDSLFIYTDGVTESTAEDESMFGEERLEALLNKNNTLSSNDLVSTVIDELERYSGNAPQFDDITILSLKLKKYK